QCAEQHWLAFIATKPSVADVATDYDNLAELCAAQARWADHAAYRTKAIAAQDTAARRVSRACAFLRLHKWDAAYADMAKANKMDATDPQVNEWLPQFERLQQFVPRIKPLDTQIAKSPNDVGFLLDRARVFTLAGRPLLALDGKSAAAHFEAARDLDALDREKEALLHARIATKLDPNDSTKWFFRGVLERQRADFTEAIASQTRSIEINESRVALSEREQC